MLSHGNLVGVVLEGAPSVECVRSSMVVMFVSSAKWVAIRDMKEVVFCSHVAGRGEVGGALVSVRC